VRGVYIESTDGTLVCVCVCVDLVHSVCGLGTLRMRGVIEREGDIKRRGVSGGQESARGDPPSPHTHRNTHTHRHTHTHVSHVDW